MALLGPASMHIKLEIFTGQRRRQNLLILSSDYCKGYIHVHTVWANITCCPKIIISYHRSPNNFLKTPALSAHTYMYRWNFHHVNKFPVGALDAMPRARIRHVGISRRSLCMRNWNIIIIILLQMSLDSYGILQMGFK